MCLQAPKQTQVSLGSNPSAPLDGEVWSSVVDSAIDEGLARHLEMNLRKWGHLPVSRLGIESSFALGATLDSPFNLLTDMDDEVLLSKMVDGEVDSHLMAFPFMIELDN